MKATYNLTTGYLERLSAQLIDSVSDAIISTNEAFVIQTWNKAAEKICGQSYHEVHGKDAREVLRYEFLNDSRDSARQQLAQTGEWKGIVVYTRYDGEKVFLNVSSSRLENDAGESIGYIAINRDITEIYRMKAQLENDQRLALALEGAGDGVWEYNFQNSEVYYSPSYKKMLGFTDNEFASDSHEWRSRIHPSDIHIVKKVEDSYDRQEIQSHSIEYRILHKSGKYIWVLDRGMLIDKSEDGKPLRVIGTQTNIDERKKAEQKVKSFLESAPDAMVIANENGIIELTNTQAENLFGYTRQEMTGQPIEMLISGGLTERHASHRKLFIQNPGRRSMGKGADLFARRKDGAQIPVEISLSPVHSEDGLMISAAIRDVTERRRTEQELMKAQQQLTSFMHNTPTLNWIIDEHNCFRFFNESYKRSFRLNDSDIGRSIYEIFPAAICDEFSSNNWRVWNSGAALETVEEGVGPDGERQIYQIFKFPLEPEDGVRLLGGVALDITDKIANQQELRLSNDRYHYASKATSDAIWDWDLQTDLIYRAESFTALFGYSVTAVSHQFELSRIHPADRGRVDSTLRHALEANETRWHDEYLYQSADGSYKTILDKGFIIRDESGKAIRMIGAMQDMTEQRRLQDQLVKEEERKKKEVLQAIIHAQERERHEISHELHDNVSQILTTCKLLLEAAAQHGGNEYIGQTQENLQKAIDEMRNLSHRLNPASLKFIGLLGSVNDLLSKINSTGTIQITFHSDAFDTTVVIDELQLALFRIVQEQLNNILKHAQARKVVIELASNDSRIRLTIMDDGKGYDLKAKKPGLGLRNIFNRAEFHKGTAQIFTEPGKGFKLQVQIPI
ncbi:MAG TPA: PAS domain S-box protein [Chitinophagaceae bacterium]